MKITRLEPDEARPQFTCGNPDLDEFYRVDSVQGGQELLAVTYNVFDDDTGDLIGFFSVSNDSVKRQVVRTNVFSRLVSNIPEEKRYSSMPSVKIGRLGISDHVRRQGVGSKIMDFFKGWFTVRNKTGCRFLLVDAYNTEDVLGFYQKNGFEFLSVKDADKETRLMYFDLIAFRE